MIDAIRLYRDITGVGLIDAKNFCVGLKEKNGIKGTSPSPCDSSIESSIADVLT
jgi:ribosomal protein L7/L12